MTHATSKRGGFPGTAPRGWLALIQRLRDGDEKKYAALGD